MMKVKMVGVANNKLEDYALAFSKAELDPGITIHSIQFGLGNNVDINCAVVNRLEWYVIIKPSRYTPAVFLNYQKESPGVIAFWQLHQITKIGEFYATSPLLKVDYVVPRDSTIWFVTYLDTDTQNPLIYFTVNFIYSGD